MYGGVHVIHSLIFEILVDIQNNIFLDYFVDLLWCCHNETQSRNEARKSFLYSCFRHTNVHALYEIQGCISHYSCNSLVVLFH